MQPQRVSLNCSDGPKESVLFFLPYGTLPSMRNSCGTIAFIENHSEGKGEIFHGLMTDMVSKMYVGKI